MSFSLADCWPVSRRTAVRTEVQIYPRHAENFVWVPDLGYVLRSDDDQVDHTRDDRPADQTDDGSLYPPLPPLLLLALLLDKVRMLG